MFWKPIKLGCLILILFFVVAICMGCSIILIGISSLSRTAPYTNDVEDVAKLLYKDNSDELRMTQDYHGVDPDYMGYDFTTKCNDKLYSPLPGQGVVTYKGTDGYIGPYANGEENTMLRIQGDAGDIVLFHGTYTVEVGDVVLGGLTPIGFNDDIGNATGCHSHIVWEPNPLYSPPGFTRDVRLALSGYNPDLGGVNCNHDCTTMASGDKVNEWRLGKGGVYAAACPPEWAFGTQFELMGQVYECRDRGGWIKCYDRGDFDPAYTELYGYDYYAEEAYCWVDILFRDKGFAYGSKTSQWRLLNGR